MRFLIFDGLNQQINKTTKKKRVKRSITLCNQNTTLKSQLKKRMFNSLFLLVQNKFNNIQRKLVNNHKINKSNNTHRILNMNIPDITDPLQNKLLQNAIQNKTNPPNSYPYSYPYCYWMFFALPMSLWRHLSPRPLLTKGPQTRHQLPIPYTNEELYKEDFLH